MIGLRLGKDLFTAPEVKFTYLDWTFLAGSPCFNECNRRGLCQPGEIWDSTALLQRPGPVCNCSGVGFNGGFSCGQEAVVAHISPRSGPLQGGTLVTLSFSSGSLQPILQQVTDTKQDLQCKFGAQIVAATLGGSQDMWLCASPPLQRNGSLPGQ